MEKVTFYNKNQTNSQYLIYEEVFKIENIHNPLGKWVNSIKMYKEANLGAGEILIR